MQLGLHALQLRVEAPDFVALRTYSRLVLDAVSQISPTTSQATHLQVGLGRFTTFGIQLGADIVKLGVPRT